MSHADGAATPAPVVPAAPASGGTGPGTFAFHRLQRTDPRVRWWRPLVIGALAFGLTVGALVPVVVALLVGAEIDGPAGPVDALLAVDVADMGDPVAVGVGLALIAVGGPAVVAATALVGARPTGLLWSVTGRVRLRWALRCAALAAVVMAASFALDTVRLVVTGVPLDAPRLDATAWWMLAVVVLLVPAQSIAEELVFRGYLMQTLGTWVRHPAFAVVLPVPLFVLGHEYVGLAMLSIAVWALAMGWLTWRTGGLEAAAAMHVVNNLVAFGLGAVGLADLEAVDVDVPGLVVQVATTAVYVVLVEVLRRRDGIARVRVAGTPPGPPARVSSPRP